MKPVPMMLKFNPDQLTMLQFALSPHQGMSVPAPAMPPPILHPNKNAEQGVEWIFRVPLLVVSLGYGGLGVMYGVCVMIHQSISESLPLLLVMLLLLHASTSKQTSILTLTGVLVGGIPYVRKDNPNTVHLWCVGLSVLFILHARRNTRLLTIFASFCCLIIWVLSVTHPKMPFHIRVGGTMCALLLGSVASGAEQMRAELVFKIKTCC